jgi:prenylcysteine oxidase/farnesylcysteine lyase
MMDSTTNHDNKDHSNIPPSSSTNFLPIPRRRVAIIGAGAAGSSAAYFLNQAFTLKQTQQQKTEEDDDVPTPEITIYESTSRIGGRVKVVNVAVNETDPETGSPIVSMYPVEIGASMFVNVNKYMDDFAQKFNLTLNQKVVGSTTTRSSSSKSKNVKEGKKGGMKMMGRNGGRGAADTSNPRPPVGIYDGSQFVYTASQSSWKTIADAIWRWGLFSTTKSRSLALETGENFGLNYKLAEENALGFKSVEGFLKGLKLENLTRVGAREYFKSQGVGELYISEFIEAATRVNYGQNLDLHALSALVCLVAAFVEAKSVAAGNELVFQEMVKRSGAEVLMGTRVTEIRKVETRDGSKFYQIIDEKGGARIFDSVILGVPSNVVSYLFFYVASVYTYFRDCVYHFFNAN